MSDHLHSVSRFPRLRRLLKPAVASGVGGTTLALWFGELIAVAADFVGVILLTILGALICLFDDLVFKSRIPGREDLQDRTNNGVKT